jgi:hypothetical protein
MLRECCEIIAIFYPSIPAPPYVPVHRTTEREYKMDTVLSASPWVQTPRKSYPGRPGISVRMSVLSQIGTSMSSQQRAKMQAPQADGRAHGLGPIGERGHRSCLTCRGICQAHTNQKCWSWARRCHHGASLVHHTAHVPGQLHPSKLPRAPTRSSPQPSASGPLAPGFGENFATFSVFSQHGAGTLCISLHEHLFATDQTSNIA